MNHEMCFVFVDELRLMLRFSVIDLLLQDEGRGKGFTVWTPANAEKQSTADKPEVQACFWAFGAMANLCVLDRESPRENNHLEAIKQGCRGEG